MLQSYLFLRAEILVGTHTLDTLFNVGSSRVCLISSNGYRLMFWGSLVMERRARAIVTALG